MFTVFSSVCHPPFEVSPSPQWPGYLLYSHIPRLCPGLIMVRQNMAQMLPDHVYPVITLLCQLSLLKTHKNSLLSTLKSTS